MLKASVRVRTVLRMKIGNVDSKIILSTIPLSVIELRTKYYRLHKRPKAGKFFSELSSLSLCETYILKAFNNLKYLCLLLICHNKMLCCPVCFVMITLS